MKKIDTEKSTILGTYDCDNYDLRLGIKGYFCHYSNFEDYTEGELDGFTHTEFMTTKEDPDGNYVNQWYDYFIPEDKVLFKEENKPFTRMNQLMKSDLFVGNSFYIRSKYEKEIVHQVIVTEISLDSKGDILCIGLGTRVFSPEELLNTFEFRKHLDSDDWRPFGIKE